MAPSAPTPLLKKGGAAGGRAEPARGGCWVWGGGLFGG